MASTKPSSYVHTHACAHYKAFPPLHKEEGFQTCCVKSVLVVKGHIRSLVVGKTNIHKGRKLEFKVKIGTYFVGQPAYDFYWGGSRIVGAKNLISPVHPVGCNYVNGHVNGELQACVRIQGFLVKVLVFLLILYSPKPCAKLVLVTVLYYIVVCVNRNSNPIPERRKEF